jgi:hypothetical protein
MTNLRTALAGTAAVLTILFTTSACGGGSHSKVASLGNSNSSSSNSESSSGSKQSFRDAMLAYAKCMRDHGVDMPDPTFADGPNGGNAVGVITPGGGGGKAPDPNAAAFQSADTACKPILDAAQKDAPQPTPEEEARMRDQALKFAQCMRGKGFDVPDPTFDDSGGMKIESKQGSTSGPSVDGGVTGAPDPAFQQGVQECSQETGGPAMAATGADAGGAK